MSTVIYCDESCHLEHDDSNVMGIGAVWLPKATIRRLSLELRDMKGRHRATGELKWTKVSASRAAFYNELVDWFFAQDGLNFRCILIPDKSSLDHAKYNQSSHDDFYYKMYFSMLRSVLSPDAQHDIYLDIKDTRSKLKVAHLREVLCHDRYDFTGALISKIQQVRSGEIELMQLCDFLLGAVVYANRGLAGNPTKVAIARRIADLRGWPLGRSSALSQQKFNVFVWTGRP